MRTYFKLLVLFVLFFLIYFSLPTSRTTESYQQKKFAYVVLNTNKKSIFSTLVLFFQLRKHKCVRGKYVVLAPSALKGFFDLFRDILKIQVVDYDDSFSLFEPKYNVLSDSTAIRDRILWQKLRVWNMTEYDRVIMLDNDLLIRRNIDALFLTSDVSGVPAVYENEKILFWDPKNLDLLQKVGTVEKGIDGLNSGVLALTPDKKEYQELLDSASSYGNRTCCPTQEFIFRHFEAKGQFKRLPHHYNMRKLHRRPDIAPDSVIIYHFVERRKPLHVGRKMSKDIMSKEWWNSAGEFIEFMKYKCKKLTMQAPCEAFEEIKRVALTFEHEMES